MRAKRVLCFINNRIHGEDLVPKPPPSPPLAWAAVCSKVVVLLLLIYCLLFSHPLWVFSVRSSFCYSVLCVLSGFAITLMQKRDLDIALIDFLMSCHC